MTLRKSLIGGVALSLGPLLLNAISLPAIALLIRQLGPSAYGQWITASALVASLSMLASLGLRGGFIRHIAARPQDTSAALADQLGARLLLSTLASILAILIGLVLHYPATVLACVALCSVAMVITTMATTFVDVLQAMHRSTSIATITFIAGVALTIASVAVSLAGGGPIAIALAYCIGPALLLAMSLRLASKYCRIRFCLRISAVKQLLYRSKSFTAQQLLNSAPFHAESILLPRLIGIPSFGFFSAGTLLASRLSVVPDGLCTAVYPLLSQRLSNDRVAGIHLATQCGAIITGVCVVIAIAATILSGPFARLLFPAQPDLCQFVLLITIWALPLMAIDSSIGYALNASGADGAQARSSFPAAICNVFLTLYLMATLGIAGACIAMPLRHLVRIVMLTSCCLRLRRERTAEQPFIFIQPVAE